MMTKMNEVARSCQELRSITQTTTLKTFQEQQDTAGWLAIPGEPDLEIGQELDMYHTTQAASAQALKSEDKKPDVSLCNKNTVPF